MALPSFISYFLELLSMIKCSICSYQCDNWYVSNRWRAGYTFVTWVAPGKLLPSSLHPVHFPHHLSKCFGFHPSVHHSVHFITPVFRLLLKVALDWTHQCDFHNFWGALSSNCIPSIHATFIRLWLPHPTHCKHMRKCYGGISRQVRQSLPNSSLSIHPCRRGNSAINDSYKLHATLHTTSVATPLIDGGCLAG